MAYQLNDVINWYLAKEAMTPKKLQKVLYYAYAWYLTLQNESADDLSDVLFDEEFEAWVHGPVIRTVYDDFRGKGFNAIEKYTGEVPSFDEDTEDILQQVWDVYGNYNGNELESITHQESPWINARKGYQPLDRCNVALSDQDMFYCYAERLED
jgi:uncharacterized phage-associated protein